MSLDEIIAMINDVPLATSLQWTVMHMHYYRTIRQISPPVCSRKISCERCNDKKELGRG